MGDVIKFLKQTKISDLFSGEKADLIHGKVDDPAIDSLKKLLKARVLSIPLYDDSKKAYTCFFDILDVLHFVAAVRSLCSPSCPCPSSLRTRQQQMSCVPSRVGLFKLISLILLSGWAECNPIVPSGFMLSPPSSSHSVPSPHLTQNSGSEGTLSALEGNAAFKKTTSGEARLHSLHELSTAHSYLSSNSSPSSSLSRSPTCQAATISSPSHVRRPWSRPCSS